MTTHQNSKSKKVDGLKKAFLANKWNSFHLLGKKVDYIHLKDFLKYECALLHLKQLLTPP